ncbi:MAG: hypothetical protein SW833_14805, partial [Cyanobacteriota bacterium]|nr:hypothetical protein [Cyanobacteriota bacterium]
TEGWLVDVRAGNRELTYRTNSDGSTVYLETDTSNNPNPLPQGVADAVKREAAQLLGTPGNELEILDARPQTWPNGCLGLELPDRVCTQALVEGWLVTVGANDQKLVYRTDERGDTVLLDNGVDVLPASVREAVLDAAARDTGFPENSLRITRAVSRLWDGCLGVYANPGQLCNEVGIPGWQVTVEGRNSLLVYHTNQDGSDLLLNGDVSRFNRPGAEENSELPEAVVKAVLNAAARQTVQAARLRITAAQRRAWDGCLGIYSDRRACPEIAISGWRVTVEGQDNVLVYHANGDGSDVRLNVPESRLQGNSSAIEPISFSPRESPPPLPRDAIFRAVSAGGITGDVREIMLWEGGKITTRTGQSGRIQTRWVSPQQVQKFQQVLGQQRFSQYDRLSFPPPTGSADIIEVALSSRQGVMRYADYETQQFPQPLQVVLNSWQELLNSAEENPSVGEVQSPTSSEKRPQREGYPWAVERFILQWFGSFF